MLSMHSIPSERRLRWLGHVHRIGSERIPRALFYGELATDLRKRGHPCLRYKDVCRKEMLLASIDQQHGKPLLRSAPSGGPVCMRAFKLRKPPSQQRVKREEPGERWGERSRSQRHRPLRTDECHMKSSREETAMSHFCSFEIFKF